MSVRDTEQPLAHVEAVGYDAKSLVRAVGRDAGELFNECVPFIPRWQLDRHAVVHRGLRVVVGDGVEQVSPRLLS